MLGAQCYKHYHYQFIANAYLSFSCDADKFTHMNSLPCTIITTDLGLEFSVR